MNKFTTSFDKLIINGDSIIAEIAPFTIKARIEFDCDSHIDDTDSHNLDQTVTGCTDEEYKKLVHARNAWEKDEWFYCGIVLSVQCEGLKLDNYAASLWGIECNYPGSDNLYLTEVANELIPEAIAVGNEILAKLAKHCR